MTKKKRSPVKKALAGGGVILALGVLLGMFMKLPGWGGGTTMLSTTSGDQSGTTTTNKDSTTDQGLPTAGLITVLIDDRDFSLAKKSGDELTYEAIALEEIVELAKDLPGNEDGIKVRVLRKETARATAEANLRNALIDAGLDAGSIYMPRSFVE